MAAKAAIGLKGLNRPSAKNVIIVVLGEYNCLG